MAATHHTVLEFAGLAVDEGGCDMANYLNDPGLIGIAMQAIPERKRSLACK